MFRKYFYSFIVILLAYLATASVSNADTYTGMGRLPGAWIVNYKATKEISCDVDTELDCQSGVKVVTCNPDGSDSACIKTLLGSCDPRADPILDGVPGKPSYQKSCISQNINSNNFTVEVKFDPKKPTTDLSGNPWGDISVPVPGEADIPKSYTTAGDGTKTFNFDLCAGVTVPPGSTCTNITTVYVNNASLTFSGAVFDKPDVVGEAITKNGNRVYLSQVAQKYPTSGIVKTNALDGNGDAITTKCKDADGNAVVSATQPTENYMVCSTGTPIVDENNALIATAVPAMVNAVYPLTVAATDTSDGVTQCVAGVTQQYALNKYVRDLACVPIKDINRCIGEGKTASNCDKYITGGGEVYDSIGELLTSEVDEVFSVEGASTADSVIPGSIFGFVFGNIPARTYHLSYDALEEISNISEKSVLLKVGDPAKPIPGTETTLVNFELRYEGGYACVYAHGQDAANEWRVEGDYPRSLNQVYDVTGDNTTMNVVDQPLIPHDITPSPKRHCVYAPPPNVDNNPLVWNSLISPICTRTKVHSDGSICADQGASDCVDPGSSQFMDSNGKKRAFTGVVVECIEDTMMGIFYSTTSSGGVTKTFFSSMQDKMQSAIRAVIALCVILFGYRLMINKKVPDRKEWTWLALKFALVIYFAAGTGMMDLFPKMLSITKNLSVIVMQAGLGIVTDSGVSEAQSNAASLNNAAIKAQQDVYKKIAEINRNTSDLALVNTQLASLNEQLIAAGSKAATSLAIRDELALLLAAAQTDLDDYEVIRQDKIDEINDAIAAINSDIAAITAAINAQNAEIAALNSQIAGLSTAITDLEVLIASQKTAFQNNNRLSEKTTAGSGTHKIPSFCTSAKIKVWGGGGAGYVGGAGNGDGSGAAGGYIEDTVTVAAGNTVSYTVGSGGINEKNDGQNSTAVYSSTTWTANGGRGGKDGSASGGSASSSPNSPTDIIQNGGNGGNSHGSCHPGGLAYQSSVVGCSPRNCAYNTATPFGSGGCSWDNNAWARGGHGKVSIECLNFNFNNLANIDNSDAAAVTLKNNINNLAALQASLASDIAALQAQIDAIELAKQANLATLATYQANLATETETLAYIVNNPPDSINGQAALIASLQAQYNEAAAQYDKDLAAYNAILAQIAILEQERDGYISLQGTLENELAALQDALILAQQAAADAQAYLDEVIAAGSVIQPNSGYSYCDFRAYTYAEGKDYMQLWDMLDCKISKYLGIGDSASGSDIPQVFVIAILAPISSAFGIPIFLISMVFLVIVIMVTLRMVHIYIMAFMALVMLVFISPLVIPSVFFEATKHMFTQWLQQLMAYLLQPVILFAALAFMFAAIDSVMFGGNYSFSADNRIKNSEGVITPSNTKCGTESPNDDALCKDKYAPAYLYQTLKINKTTYPNNDIPIIDVYRIDFGADDGKYLFIGLIKLMLIAFIVHALLSKVEELSSRFVGAMKGANVLSTAPVASASAVLGGISSASSAAKNLAEGTYESAKRTGHAIKHYKSTGGAIKRAVLNSTPAKAGRAAAAGARAAADGANWISDKINENIASSQEASGRKAVGDFLKEEAKNTEKTNAENAHKLMTSLANKKDDNFINHLKGHSPEQQASMKAERKGIRTDRADNKAANEAWQNSDEDLGIAGMFARGADNSAAEAKRTQRAGNRESIEAARQQTEDDSGVGRMFDNAEKSADRAENRKSIEAARQQTEDNSGVAGMFARGADNSAAEKTREGRALKQSQNKEWQESAEDSGVGRMFDNAEKSADRAENRKSIEVARQQTEDNSGVAGMFARGADNSAAEATRTKRAENKSSNKLDKDGDGDSGLTKLFGDDE